MRLPVRMNYVEIKIRVLDLAGTPRDNDFRQAKRDKKFTDVVVQGQINLGQKNVDDRLRTHTGDAGPRGAWCVFRICDLEDLAWEPKKGDRVTEVAGRAVAFEIKQVRPESPLRGQFLLLYCVLEEVKEERASL